MPLSILLAILLASAFTGPVAKARRADSLTRYGVGLLRVRSERPVTALAAFEAASKAAPDAAPPKAELARLYADLGRPAAATRVAKQAVAADPGDFATGQLLGKLLLAAGHPAEAVAALRVAAASPRLTDPERKFALVNDLARAADAAKDWPALEAATRAAIALKPGGADLGEAYERLGHSFEARKQFEAACGAYKTATESATGPAATARRAWLLSGVLLAEDRPGEALDELEKVLRRKPTGVEPYDRLVTILTRQNRLDRVAPTLDTLTEQNPRNAVIPWVAAEALARTDPAAGWTRFRALANSSASAKGAARLVRFALSSGREAELLDLLDQSASSARGGRDESAPGAPRDAAERAAVERFRLLVAAAKADPAAAKLLDDPRLPARHEETRELLVVIAERAGRPELLEAILRAGANSNPARLILALLRQRKPAEALRLSNELEANPPRGGLVPYYDYYRAEAYHQLGRTALALRSLDAAARAGMDSAVVRLDKARILADVGRADDATALCQAVIAEKPRPAQLLSARIRLAAVLGDEGKYAESDAQYDLARDLDPDSALLWNNYGYNLADQGRRLADAEAMLRHAVELARDESFRLGNAEPTSGTYLDSLAWVLFRRNKLAESRELFERATRTAEGAADAIVWDHLGDVYARLGESTKAKAAWVRAVELYADTAQGRKGGRMEEARRKLGGR